MKVEKSKKMPKSEVLLYIYIKTLLYVGQHIVDVNMMGL